MGLRSHTVKPSIPVADMARAKAFYEGKLGLSEGRDEADGARTYACGGGSALHVHPSPAHAGRAPATLATWEVDDVERVVDELSANGVTFERYDDPALQADAKGIFTLDDGMVAWFKDPDGNTFAVESRSA